MGTRRQTYRKFGPRERRSTAGSFRYFGVVVAAACCLLLPMTLSAEISSQDEVQSTEDSVTELLADLELIREAREAERRLLGLRDRLGSMDRELLEILLVELVAERWSGATEEVGRVVGELQRSDTEWKDTLLRLLVDDVVSPRVHGVADGAADRLLRLLTPQVQQSSVYGIETHSTHDGVSAPSHLMVGDATSSPSPTLLAPLAMSSMWGSHGGCCAIGEPWTSMETSGPEVNLEARFQGTRWSFVGSFGWGSKRIVRR